MFWAMDKVGLDNAAMDNGGDGQGGGANPERRARTAAALFAETVSSGLIKPGKLESELARIFTVLARQRFGLRLHWTSASPVRAPIRCSPITMKPRIGASARNDIVYLDFGRCSTSGRRILPTYALGADPDKHRLVADITAAFSQGRVV